MRSLNCGNTRGGGDAISMLVLAIYTGTYIRVISVAASSSHSGNLFVATSV